MCVVSLEEVNITPGNVPYELCREIRTDEGGIRQKLDYVIVPASAAIIGAVIVSVIVFIVCLKSSQRKRKGKVSLGTLILAFFINFWTININLYGKTVWRQALGFQKFATFDELCPLKI